MKILLASVPFGGCCKYLLHTQEVGTPQQCSKVHRVLYNRGNRRAGANKGRLLSRDFIVCTCTSSRANQMGYLGASISAATGGALESTC